MTATRTSLSEWATWAVTDTAMMTWRNLMSYVRVPYLFFYAAVQPILFTVLFTYVFGGAIQPPKGSYVDYLLPGIIVQTVIFGSMFSALNLAEDMQKGIIDRFRSLPIARGSLLAARAMTDTVRNTVSVFIMVGVGLLLGYRFGGSALDAVLAVGLLVLIGFAFSWVASFIGLLAKDAQAAELGAFTWMFPLVFLSSIFVPTVTMTPIVQAFANANPITHAADAVRAFSYGDPAAAAATTAVVWCVGIIAVFGALATWRFKRLA